MNRKVDLKIERDRDFLRAYREAVMEVYRTTVSGYVREAVKKPSKRFWIEPSTLENIISDRGVTCNATVNKDKRRMYRHLYEMYLSEREENPQSSVIEICTDIVERPAPEFYMSVSTGVKIVCRNNSRKRRLRREKK